VAVPQQLAELSKPKTDALDRLSAQGVAIWLDDLSRELLAGGGLQRLVDAMLPGRELDALSLGNLHVDRGQSLTRCQAHPQAVPSAEVYRLNPNVEQGRPLVMSALSLQGGGRGRRVGLPLPCTTRWLRP